MKNFNRGELLEQYITKLLYRQDNRKFEKEYLKNQKEIRDNERRNLFLQKKILREILSIVIK